MKKFAKFAEKILHIPSVSMLFFIWVVFTILALKTLGFAVYSIFSWASVKEFLSEIFLVFLFIEIVASIKIYFAKNFHFPLRFFLYIWITDLIRHWIIYSEDWEKVLLISWWVLILAVALVVIELKNNYLKRLESKKDEELSI
jgi:protein PsiE